MAAISHESPYISQCCLRNFSLHSRGTNRKGNVSSNIACSPDAGKSGPQNCSLATAVVLSPVYLAVYLNVTTRSEQADHFIEFTLFTWLSTDSEIRSTNKELSKTTGCFNSLRAFRIINEGCIGFIVRVHILWVNYFSRVTHILKQYLEQKTVQMRILREAIKMLHLQYLSLEHNRIRHLEEIFNIHQHVGWILFSTCWSLLYSCSFVIEGM